MHTPASRPNSPQCGGSVQQAYAKVAKQNTAKQWTRLTVCSPDEQRNACLLQDLRACALDREAEKQTHDHNDDHEQPVCIHSTPRAHQQMERPPIPTCQLPLPQRQ